MPFFSIIIPTFNATAVLPRAIDSILSQGFDDYEIWIIDGGSADTTLEIVQAYQLADKRIQVVSEPDKGIYDAMNKGIDRAKGQWLYFMGSDDRLYNNEVLKNIALTALNCNCDVLYGNVFSTHFGGTYDGSFTAAKLYNQNICHQAIFAKRQLFQTVGYFNTNYKTHADWEHNIKWFVHPDTRHVHIDLVIAEFGAGGFSSQHGDKDFFVNKDEAFLTWGGTHLDKAFKTFLLESMANQLKIKKKYTGYLKYKLKSIISRYA